MIEMRTKGGLPSESVSGKDLSPLLGLYFEINQLKQLFRQGWLRVGVPEDRCETVAEHSFAVALLSILLVDEHFPHLDVGKVARMALLHELGEIDAGDIIPADDVGEKEKRKLETDGVKRILSRMPNGPGMMAIWEEFEEGTSPEARLVRDVDKVEMAYQAGVYRMGGLGDVSHFFASARRLVQSPELKALIDEVTALEE